MTNIKLKIMKERNPVLRDRVLFSDNMPYGAFIFWYLLPTLLDSVF